MQKSKNMVKLAKFARIDGVINNGIEKKRKTWSNWQKSQELLALSIMTFNAEN